MSSSEPFASVITVVISKNSFCSQKLFLWHLGIVCCINCILLRIPRTDFRENLYLLMIVCLVSITYVEGFSTGSEDPGSLLTFKAEAHGVWAELVKGGIPCSETGCQVPHR